MGPGKSGDGGGTLEMVSESGMTVTASSAILWTNDTGLGDVPLTLASEGNHGSGVSLRLLRQHQ